MIRLKIAVTDRFRVRVRSKFRFLVRIIYVAKVHVKIQTTSKT